MPTAITHAFVAVAAGAACFGPRQSAKFWILATVCSAGPDLDIGLHAYGVAYEDLWGHRGMMHSLPFALVISLLVVTFAFLRETPLLRRPLRREWWALASFFFLLTASHGFADAFTDGGLGIAFFSPFDTSRHFMPWRPLRVADFGLSSLLTANGGRVMLSEILWVWVPVALVTLPVILLRRGRQDEGAASS